MFLLLAHSLLAAKTSHLVRNSQILTQVRNEAVTAALDAARKQTLIGSSLEARVVLRVPAGSLVADAMATLTTDELVELIIELPQPIGKPRVTILRVCAFAPAEQVVFAALSTPLSGVSRVCRSLRHWR